MYLTNMNVGEDIFFSTAQGFEKFASPSFDFYYLLKHCEYEIYF